MVSKASPAGAELSGQSERRRQDRARLIAKRLAQLRRERELSQDALGSLVGASQATVSRWEDEDSASVPSAVELAEIADRFEVAPAWLLGMAEHQEALPVGHAVLDQGMLDAFAGTESEREFEALLERELNFGTIWVQVPQQAEVVQVQEAMRRVKEVDRRVRKRYPDLWHRWAALVLR